MKAVSPLAAVGAGILLMLPILGCSWEVPEAVRFRGSPQVALPLGAAEFEFDDLVNVDEIANDFVAALTANDAFDSAERSGDGRPVTIDALIAFDSETPGWFDDSAVGEVEFETSVGPIDISDIFGPLPEGVNFRSVPLTVEVEVEDGESLTEKVTVQLVTRRQSGAVFDIGDQEVELDNDNRSGSYEIKNAVNARPADLLLEFIITAHSDDVDKIDAINVTLTLPFAFELEDPDAEVALDLSDDDDGEDFAFDDDIFGRDPDDPDEDLDDFVASLRGSNAQIVLDIQDNTVGLIPIIRLKAGDSSGMLPPDASGVIFETEIPPQEGPFTLEVEITPARFNDMIDTMPFHAQFEFLLPPEFQLNSEGVLNIESGFMRVQARMDYTFTFDREDD